MARYEIRRADTAEVVSRHRTKQGAIDASKGHRDVAVEIWRTYSRGAAELVVEATWRRP